MKAALRVVYPPQCLSCGAGVDRDGTLCPLCWRDCEFITGCACTRCGLPLPLPGAGEAGDDLLCDDCLVTDRPWQAGRAAVAYRGIGRDLVLALKHGDRPDLAGPLGEWLARAAGPLIAADMLVVPIPLHPRRLLKRKYNQAALLSARLAAACGLRHAPGLLRRIRATPAQDHRSHAERYENLRGAFAVPPRFRDQIKGRAVLLVDDVMASGASMTAATRALQAVGAGAVSVAVLARAMKD